MKTEHKPEIQIHIYRPNQRHDLGYFKVWIIMINNIRKSKRLIWELFKRDFLASYKKSFVGITWIFIAPIMAVVQWVFLNMTGMLDPGDLGIPYPVYVLIGTSMWGMFTGFYDSASATLSAGLSFIMQVNYPHETLLFKQIAEYLANFLITFLINIVVILAFGVTPSWKIIFFPVVALPLLFLGTSIGLLVSMIKIVAIDIEKMISTGISLLMWITPIVYSNKFDNHFIQSVIKWNPLTYLVCSVRDIIIYGKLYDVKGFFICAAASLILFLISWRLFFVSEDKLIERMI